MIVVFLRKSLVRYAELLEAKLARFLEKKSILLLGPRQVGKSTLLRALEPDLTINLADEATYLAHLKAPVT